MTIIYNIKIKNAIAWHLIKSRQRWISPNIFLGGRLAGEIAGDTSSWLERYGRQLKRWSTPTKNHRLQILNYYNLLK